MSEARRLIDTLGLKSHPEGGWYRETFRQPANDGDRALTTAILFLLDHEERSHWHRVDGAELWLWHAGHPLSLLIDDGQRREITLGGNVMAGETPQALVPVHAWQATEARAGWALVSCVVTPGFEFSGFELAPPGWEPPTG